MKRKQKKKRNDSISESGIIFFKLQTKQPSLHKKVKLKNFPSLPPSLIARTPHLYGCPSSPLLQINYKWWPISPVLSKEIFQYEPQNKCYTISISSFFYPSPSNTLQMFGDISETECRSFPNELQKKSKYPIPHISNLFNSDNFFLLGHKSYL